MSTDKNLVVSRRTRRSPELAKQRILEAAHQVFLEGGADAVKVQPIAKMLGITDAAIHYHFKNRENLLEALLTFGAKRLKQAVDETSDGNLAQVAENLSSVYDDQGFARLAAWFALAGRQSTQSGLFDEMSAQAQQELGVSDLEARRSVALLNMALTVEPLFAGAFLQAVSLENSPRSRRLFRRWMIQKLTRAIP
ncbi:MAG: TetR/AcrR family transcriptional regulator [Pseudomonadota bacterium]